MDYNEASLLLDLLIKLFNMDGGTIHRVNGLFGNAPPHLVASRGLDTLQEIIEHLFERNLVEHLQKLRHAHQDDLCLDMVLIGSYFPGVKPILHARQVKSLLITPLFNHEQLVGVLAVFGRNYTALAQGDTELLASISDRLGNLLKNLEAGMEELQPQAARAGWRATTVMGNLLRMSSSADSLDEYLVSSLALLSNGLHADKSFITFQDPLLPQARFHYYAPSSLPLEAREPSREFSRMSETLQQLTVVRPESPVMTSLPAVDMATSKMHQALLVPARDDSGASMLACFFLRPDQQITDDERDSLQPLISLLLNQARWIVAREQEDNHIRALDILTNMAGELAVCDIDSQGIGLLAQKCLDILDCDRTAIVMLDESRGLYETVVKARGDMTGDGLSFAYGPHMAKALNCGLSDELNQEDISEDIMVLPLVGRESRLGALVLEKSGGFSSLGDLPGRLAHALAAQASLLLESNRERLFLRKATDDIEFMFSLNRRLFHAQTLDELGTELSDQLHRHLGADMLLVSWPNRAGHPAAWQHGKPLEAAPFEEILSAKSFLSLALARDGHYSCNNLSASLRSSGERALARLQMRSCAAVPLIGEGEGRGVIMIASERGSAFGEDSLARLGQVAEVLLSASRLPSLYDQLEREYARLSEAYGQLKEVTGMQGDLLHIAAHEIRSPLTLIMGFSEVMRDYYDTMDMDERTKVVDRLLRSVDRLRRSVINMLELSQLESGQFSIQADYFDMQSLLNDLAEELKPRSIPCELEMIGNGGLGPVFADRDKVEIVLFNLIDNAIKFSSPGSRISVSCRRESDRIVLDVSDQGRGISSEHVNSIFEPFERGQEAQRVTAQGMGLGLYIVRKLVEAHGGEVKLRTVPGEGSTFSVILPQAGYSSGSLPGGLEVLQA